MLTTSKGKRIIVLTDANLKPTNYVEVGDIKVRGVRWAGEKYLIVTRSDTQKLGDRFIAKSAEFSNLMIVPADGGDVKIVFHGDRTMLNAVFGDYGVREIGGKLYAFVAGSPMSMGQKGQYFWDGAATSLYRVDLATNEATRIASGISNELTNDWLIDLKGQIAAHMEVVEKSGDWTLNNAAGRKIASGREDGGSAAILGYGANRDTLIYVV